MQQDRNQRYTEKEEKKIANDMTTVPNSPQKIISKIHKQNGQI